eukprot:6363001-Prymnesium_polylepis.1
MAPPELGAARVTSDMQADTSLRAVVRSPALASRIGMKPPAARAGKEMPAGVEAGMKSLTEKDLKKRVRPDET